METITEGFKIKCMHCGNRIIVPSHSYGMDATDNFGIHSEFDSRAVYIHCDQCGNETMVY